MHRFATLLIVVAMIGCTEPAGDQSICAQTYEFGNYGCVVVRGQVVDQQDRALANISVGLGVGAEGGQFDSPFVDTGPDGRFQFRLTRFLTQMPGTSTDSASVWVRAVVKPNPGEGTAKIRDSVLTRVHVVGVGARPDTMTIKVALTYTPGLP